ncbi:MAG: flagellar export protein FliJ [Clostridiales bacterium]|jgi:flagellar FliJ protein|nr:flagellar export protein FliJ [Clostridiales bacterium]
MKKFHYSMESILKLKLKLEDQAKLAYAGARNRLTIEEEKLSSMENKKSSYEKEQREQGMAKLNIKKMRQLSDAIEIMKINIKQQTVVVKTATQRLEIARIRLNDAMIERKTHDKLKEKAWQEYMMEATAEEQKEIDERNSFNYNSFLLYEEDR